jgi:asparagine synthase (glutamine-hydrolysing)
MPPIFGIINTRLQTTDLEIINRMKGAAKYVKPRKVEALEIAGGYFASAINCETPLAPINEVIAVFGPLAVIADANLYKPEELILRLGNNDTRFPVSNAALILKAFLKWGKDCMKYIYGDFAFVIFNLQTGNIFCGRDPMGVRPLFYCITDQRFIFGSELRYLTASFHHKPSICDGYLFDTLTTVKTDKELTPFKNLYRLKPGHFLSHGGGETQLLQYWAPDLKKTIRYRNEEDYIRLFREKLINAVETRCISANIIGSELSGGLDSSAVTSIAADFTSRKGVPLSAFSNIFPGETRIEFKDEEEFIKSFLNFKQVEWTGVDQLSMSIPELLDNTLLIQGCFIQQSFNIFNRGIYKAAGEKSVDVLLSGFGGDELVSARTAMPWNELINERQWRVIIDELYYKGVSPKTLLKSILIAAGYLNSRVCKPTFTRGWATPELLNKRFASLPLQKEFALRNQLRQRLTGKFKRPVQPTQRQWQYSCIIQEHLTQRMEYSYAAAAQFGIEYRYPLLDVDLIETCLAMPPWLKKHHGTNRYIFRQAIAGIVPEKIRQRNNKSGAVIPQTHSNLIKAHEQITDIIKTGQGNEYLSKMFDFSRFMQWYEKLIKRDIKEMNYLMPGAFYNYLMIMLYYRDKGQVTRDR